MKTFSGNDGLRAKIRGYQLTSNLIRRQITKSSGDAKHELKLYKKQCGQEARRFLVALGLLRGFEYNTIEHNCKTTNELNVEQICRIMNEHKSFHDNTFAREYVEQLLSNGKPTHVFTCVSCEKPRLPLRMMKGYSWKRDLETCSNRCKTCAQKAVDEQQVQTQQAKQA